MSNEVVTYEQKVGALSVGDVRAQVNLIQEVMREVMKKDEHFGVIPGTGNKPSLYKAGAEKLCLTFRLAPQYEVTERRDGGHLTVLSTCTLVHIPTGQKFGTGMGSCSTMESKYAYRNSARKCPACGKEAIIKGKEEYGGGWVCFKKKDGCGAKFVDKDQAIIDQPSGRVPNEDLADQYNTVLKMANKRSLVAAVLNTTAASDIFTQDIEDMPAGYGAPVEAEVVREEPKRQAKPKAPESVDPNTGEVIDRTADRLADAEVIAACKTADELGTLVTGMKATAAKMKDSTRRAWIIELANQQDEAITQGLAEFREGLSG